MHMEFSKRLVGSGKWKGHLDYEPAIWPLGNGERCNLVAKVVLRDDITDGGHWCQGIITGQRFRLVADLPKEIGCPKVTILNGAKTYYRWPMLVIDKKAELLIHAPDDQSRMTELIETCSDLGGIACGAAYAGWTLHAQNDINPRFVHLQQQSGDVPIIEGDIGSMHTVSALHRAHAKAGSLAFGFACQPYSTAGDKREGQDSRSTSLPSSLYAAHLLQKDIVVCECVPGAATSKYVLACLDYHMEMTSSDRSEILLELADVWPSKRRRWWTVIVKQFIGRVPLQPLPKLDMDISVSCLLHQFMPLGQEELNALLLSAEERKGFASYGKGIGANVVDKNQPLATALHSWGNQLIPCSCGCRGPFSHERLSKRGLFGALVHVPGMPPDKNLRHISPREVALLTGFPRKVGWNADPRLLLAGLGQVASPIQAAWIFALIRSHLVESKIIPGPSMSPKEILTCVTSDLCDLRDQWAPQSTSVTTQLFQERFDEWLLTKEGQVSYVPSDPLACDEMTVSQEQDLLNAVQNIEAHVEVIHRPIKDNDDQTKVSAADTHDKHLPCRCREHPNQKQKGLSRECSAEIGPGLPLLSHPPVVLKPHQPDPSGFQKDHAVPLDPVKPSESVVSPNAIDAVVDLPKPSQGPQAIEPSQSVAKQGSEELCKASEFELFHHSGSAPASKASSTAHPVVPTHVSQNDPAIFTVDSQVMQSIASPIWDASGAISAFATRTSNCVPPPSLSVAQQAVKEQPMHPPILSSAPKDLVEQGVLVYDADLHSISHQKCSPDTTFSQWCVANQTIGIQIKECWDLFGRSIAPDTSLVQLKWIIVGSQPIYHGASDLETITNLLAHMPRIESALLQGPAVASDEMMFYLSAISAVGLAKAKPPFILDGMTDLLVDAQVWIGGVDQVNECNAQQLVYSADRWINFQPVTEATVTAIWSKYHWIPVWIVPTSDGIVVHTTFDGIKVWELLFPWWQTVVQVHDDLPKSFDHDCGFRAFAWLVSQSTQTPLYSLSAAEAWGWRHLFWQTLVTTPRGAQRFVLGGQSELETALQAILREHGVFPSRLSERTAQLIKSFPAQSLSSAFQSSRPWQTLKQMASNHKPPIRLVLEDELQTAIRSRAKDKKSVQARSKAPAGVQAPLHVKPDDILIPHGIFRLQTGEPVSHISPQQLGQNVHGVVAFTEPEVQPYLHHAPAAAVGIGFLVLSPYSEAIAQQGQIVRFPVQSKVTSEPMLVSAVLLQRGAVQIVRNMPAQPAAVEQVSTQTIKCLLYKDQLQDQWQSVISAPVKFIIGMVEALQVCKLPECSCPKWHPHTQKSDTPILDVWQRDFLSIHFQKIRQSDAQIYAVAMRVTAEVYSDLFAVSGNGGLYIEPRSDDGRGQDEKYHTIWIPRQPLSEIKALQAILTTHVSLIRVGFRYGFKVRVDEAEQVHSQINPHEPFIAGASKATYRVGPFPWGTTKKAIQVLFAQWQWQARPVHTIAKAKDSSGLMWLVHASSPPAALVFQLQHGDVVIHQETSAIKEPWRPPQVQASNVEFREKKDIEFDPWAEAASRLPRQESVTHAQIATIEANLEQKLTKRFQTAAEESDVSMSAPLEPRVAQLEQQLAALQTRSGVIETKVDYVHKQVEQQSSKFEAALDSKLSEQMQRIEALIIKRARSNE